MASKKRKGKKAAVTDAPAMAEDDSWRAQDDLRTIQRAHEVVTDTKRFGAAKSEAKRQRTSLERIARIEGKKL